MITPFENPPSYHVGANMSHMASVHAILPIGIEIVIRNSIIVIVLKSIIMRSLEMSTFREIEPMWKLSLLDMCLSCSAFVQLLFFANYRNFIVEFGDHTVYMLRMYFCALISNRKVELLFFFAIRKKLAFQI